MTEPQFHETETGKRFFDSQLPDLICRQWHPPGDGPAGVLQGDHAMKKKADNWSKAPDVTRIANSVVAARTFEQVARLLRAYAASDGDSILYLGEARKFVTRGSRQLTALRDRQVVAAAKRRKKVRGRSL